MRAGLVAGPRARTLKSSGLSSASTHLRSLDVSQCQRGLHRICQPTLAQASLRRLGRRAAAGRGRQGRSPSGQGPWTAWPASLCKQGTQVRLLSALRCNSVRQQRKGACSRSVGLDDLIWMPTWNMEGYGGSTQNSGECSGRRLTNSCGPCGAARPPAQGPGPGRRGPPGHLPSQPSALPLHGAQKVLQGRGEDLVDQGQRLAVMPKQVLPAPKGSSRLELPAGESEWAERGGGQEAQANVTHW